jgi:hypothetical protein
MDTNDSIALGAVSTASLSISDESGNLIETRTFKEGDIFFTRLFPDGRSERVSLETQPWQSPTQQQT